MIRDFSIEWVKEKQIPTSNKIIDLMHKQQCLFKIRSLKS